MARSVWALAAWPIGDTSPGPCQAVLALHHAPSRATFMASDTPDLRNVDTDVVNQPVFHQLYPLMGIIAQFARGDGHKASLRNLELDRAA